MTEIAGVEKGPRDKPVTDVVIKKVTIAREKGKGAAKAKAKDKDKDKDKDKEKDKAAP